MFPCRPASHQRSVRLGGDDVVMSMHSCTAEGTVYALSFADVQTPARVDAAIDDLSAAVQSHFRPIDAAASHPAAVRGMTPHPRAVTWRLVGRLPDGRVMQESTALFRRGTRVYQATMLGASLDAQARETFFDAVQVGP
jgi:hypothetical protein